MYIYMSVERTGGQRTDATWLADDGQLMDGGRTADARRMADGGRMADDDGRTADRIKCLIDKYTTPTKRSEACSERSDDGHDCKLHRTLSKN